MEFIATEAGFADGMGGASNSMDAVPQHYVLFGRQIDDQHAEYSGIYFEFDDQIHGAVNCVAKVIIAKGIVEFALKSNQRIAVRCGMEEPKWADFLKGIHDTFGAELVEVRH